MPEPLVFDMSLKCSVAHAFEVFTARTDLWWPKGHRRFEGSTLRHETQKGGKLMEVATSGDTFVLADILDYDPPHRITLAWHPGKNTAPTHSEITFTATGPDAARIRVVHSEGAAALGRDWPARAALFSKGWTAVLAGVATYIETEGQEQ